MKSQSDVTIYALSDPRTGEVRYVGKTVRLLSERLHAHLLTAKNGGKYHKDRWVAQLLNAGVTPAIVALDVVPKSSWQEAERTWIAIYRELGARLTNISAGGQGVDVPRTEIWKKRISEAHKGKILAPNVHLKKRVTVVCAACGATLEKQQHQVQDGKKNYCNRKCTASGRREEILSYLQKGQKANAERIAQITHCPKGHAYTADNLVARPRATKDCKTCHRIQQRERQRRKRHGR